MPDDPGYLTLVPPWKTGPSRELLRTRIFKLFERRATSPSDPSKSGDFVYLESADWVNVIALTPDERVVMVEQYRHGVDRVTLEVPGGIMDPGEDPAETCRRELLEESGYAGDAVRLIGKISANAAMLNNWVHTGLVTDARLVSHLEPDHLEELAVRLVPLREIPDLIRRSVIHHSLVVAAFHHLSLAR